MKAKVTTTHEFSEKDIGYLMAAAFEGGINYWCNKVEILSQPDKPEIEYASDVIGYNGKLTLHVEEEKHTLSLENVLKGIKMHCEELKINPAELIEIHDAEDADCIIQYALFNELVYG